MARLTGARSLRTGLAVLLLSAAACWAAAGMPEYQVKAVFLFNFAQFVEWPANAFPNPDTPFVIGILGQDPFGSRLDEVVRGEAADKRPIRVERYHDVGEISNCNILFIGRNAIGELPQILAAIRGRSILTVSDAEGADQTGVMIRLVTRDDRIRMQIDLHAAKSSNLVISSKLLRPAEIVGPGEG